MNRLIISMFAIGMAFTTIAGACDTEPQTTKGSCAYAYRLKMAGKTIKAKKLEAKIQCEADECWAKSAAHQMAGYLYNWNTEECGECDTCDCNLWTDVKCIAWDQNKVEVPVTGFAMEVFDVLRNEGAKNQVQLKFKINDIEFAGQGTYNPKTGKLKSASGYYIGTEGTPMLTYQENPCSLPIEVPCCIYTPCSLETEVVEKAVVYGRWSLTYKDDKVKQIEKTNSDECLKPAKFVAAE